MKKIEEIKLLLNLNEFSTHKGFPNERNDVMVDKTIFVHGAQLVAFFKTNFTKSKQRSFLRKRRVIESKRYKKVRVDRKPQYVRRDSRRKASNHDEWSCLRKFK